MTQLISKPRSTYLVALTLQDGRLLAYITDKEEVVFTADATLDNLDTINSYGNLAIEGIKILFKEVFKLRYVEPVE